jgi:hypothetical protein
MALAFISEVGPDQRRRSNSSRSQPSRLSKDVLFILAWAGCQAIRLFGLQVLQGTSESRHQSSDSTNQQIFALAGMVFLDKYTGPLGSAALDRALLQILGWAPGSAETNSRKRRAHYFWVPRSFLWQLRSVVSKVERSICQLVLLHGTSGLGVQPEFLSFLFTAATSSGVLLCLLFDGDSSQGEDPGDSVEQYQCPESEVPDPAEQISRKEKKVQ